MRAGGWQVGVGRELNGATLGLVGLGRLGSKVAQFGQAFGMTTLAWSQNLTEAAAAERGVRRVDKALLFKAADFISVHVQLSARTRGLIGAADLALMKPDAYLINTSRGPIVDVDALVEVLEAGRIAGAALDVYDLEPLPPDDRLRRIAEPAADAAYRLCHARELCGVLSRHGRGRRRVSRRQPATRDRRLAGRDRRLADLLFWKRFQAARFIALEATAAAGLG